MGENAENAIGRKKNKVFRPADTGRRGKIGRNREKSDIDCVGWITILELELDVGDVCLECK